MTNRRQFMIRTAAYGLAAGATTALAGCANFEESPLLKAQHLTDDAVATVERFKTIEGLHKFAQFLPDAKGIAIFPRIIKASFFVGGEGGNGVMMAHRADGSWSEPAFYTMGAGSFGLQFGAQDTEVILVLRSQGAINAVLSDQAKFGADGGVTAGVYGVGGEASTTTNFGFDILAFANSRLGAYIGVSLEGAVMARRQDMNEAVYGGAMTPAKIVADPNLHFARAERLKAVLAS